MTYTAEKCFGDYLCTFFFSHTLQGMEVLDLATGRPLTRLKLTADRAVTYADVDNNGILDQVKGDPALYIMASRVASLLIMMCSVFVFVTQLCTHKGCSVSRQLRA